MCVCVHKEMWATWNESNYLNSFCFFVFRLKRMHCICAVHILDFFCAYFFFFQLHVSIISWAKEMKYRRIQFNDVLDFNTSAIFSQLNAARTNEPKECARIFKMKTKKRFNRILQICRRFMCTHLQLHVQFFFLSIVLLLERCNQKYISTNAYAHN